MRITIFLAAGVAALAGVAAASTGAVGGGIRCSFLGKLTAPASGGHISISVESGNRPALRAMLGKSVDQTFAYADQTEFLQWSNGVPTVVEPGDLDVGDYVRVNVRAPAGSSLATIESKNAGPRLIRAEVVVGGPRAVNDFRIDRGVIVSTAPGSITLRERDGTVVTIAVTPATRVVGGLRVTDVSQLRPPMRVLVVRKANAPAGQIQVEGRLAR